MHTIGHTLQAQATMARQKTALMRTPLRLLVSAMLAGAYIGVGVVLMVSTAGPLLASGDGSVKLVSGLVFGAALTLVVFAGGELVTSAMMILPQGVAMRSISGWAAIGGLLVVFACNFIGALVFAWMVHVSGVLTANTAAFEMLQGMLSAKADATPAELFTRGVLCNVLVCLAIWMGNRVDQPGAKITLIFVAITAFISSGFEHVVANMTTYGLGMFFGDANATVPLFANNMLWVGLGNLVGGALIVGLGYWVVAGRPRFTEHELTSAT